MLLNEDILVFQLANRKVCFHHVTISGYKNLATKYSASFPLDDWKRRVYENGWGSYKRPD